MIRETLGVGALGTQPVGSGILHDPAVVTVTTIGTITTGGPDITIDWSFSQPQNDPQTHYRVEILNDALDTTYYDSGWLTGADLSHSVDVDAEGVPHESSDVTARVSVRAERGEVTDQDPFIIDFGVPHCTITAPADESVQETLGGVSVSWTFTDDDGANTQGWYRVRLLLDESSLVIHDSGWVASAATTYNIPSVLNDGSSYRVEVQLKNNHGIRSD